MLQYYGVLFVTWRFRFWNGFICCLLYLHFHLKDSRQHLAGCLKLGWILSAVFIWEGLNFSFTLHGSFVRYTILGSPDFSFSTLTIWSHSLWIARFLLRSPLTVLRASRLLILFIFSSLPQLFGKFLVWDCFIPNVLFNFPFKMCLCI